MPPPPARFDLPFQPYAVGLVEFPERILVLGRITNTDIAALTIGAAVELVSAHLCNDGEENEVVTWMFTLIEAYGEERRH